MAGARCYDRDRGPGEGGYGVQTAGEHFGNPADQDVAERTATDGGDGPEDDGLRRPEPVCQGLAGAGDAEQAEPRGVGKVDSQGVPVQGLAGEERDQCRAGPLPPGHASR